LTHILPPLPEAAAINTSNDFIPRTPGCYVLVSLGLKLLDAGNLIPGRAIVACNLGLDNDHRTYLVGDAEVGGLPETRNPIGSAGFAVGDASLAKSLLDSIFHHFAYKFGNSVSMSGKWAT